MRRALRRSGSGLTLAEVLVTLGIMGTVLGLGAMVFAQVIRLKAAQDRYYRRLDASDYLLRRIAEDVRSAAGFATASDGYQASETTLILITEKGKTIYTPGEAGLQRIELAGDVSHGVPVFDAPGVRVRFALEGASPEEARSVVTTLEWEEPPKVGISRPTLSLRAALRSR